MDTKKPIEKCEFLCVHENVVQDVLEKMPEEELLYDLAEFFKVFGDSTRIRILYALRETELCVCDIASLLGLGEIMKRKAGKLSGGWQRRLSIAMALISEPQILFLDEPTLGLDVIARSDLWEIIKELKGKITAEQKKRINTLRLLTVCCLTKPDRHCSDIRSGNEMRNMSFRMG